MTAKVSAAPSFTKASISQSDLMRQRDKINIEFFLKEEELRKKYQEDLKPTRLQIGKIKKILVKREEKFLLNKKGWKFASLTIGCAFVITISIFSVNSLSSGVNPILVEDLIISTLAFAIFLIIGKLRLKKLKDHCESCEQKLDKLTEKKHTKEQKFNSDTRALKEWASAIQSFRRKRATKIIQRFWKKNKDTPDFTGLMGAWLKSHQSDFIAHAIFSLESVDHVMNQGRVKPAEMIFRETRSIEYEKYSQSRGQDTFPPELLERLKTLPPVEKCGLSFSFSRIEEAESESFLKNYPFSFDFSTYSGPYSDRVKYFPPSCYHSFAATTQINELFQSTPQALRKGLSEYHYKIMRDELRDPRDRIDTLLTAFYTHYITTKEASRANETCYSARMFVCGASKLNPEIRAGDNCIFWSYGQVVVLRGNSRSIIDTFHGKEVALLPPYRNGGKFFCLELNRPDTVILGPKDILKKYQKQGLPYYFAFIEDLTPRQKNRLRVPFSLDPIGKRAIDRSKSDKF